MNEVKDSVEFYRNLWAGAEARLAESQAEVARLTDEVGLLKFGGPTIEELYESVEDLSHRAELAEAEVARLRADAERYRWLRDHGRTPDHEFYEIAWGNAYNALSWTKSAEAIDAAVDRAMRAALEPTR